VERYWPLSNTRRRYSRIMQVYGEVQEWLNWPLSKSGEPKGSEGSNPSLSAKKNNVRPDVIFLVQGLNPRVLALAKTTEGSAQRVKRKCVYIFS
jgi:hypothetical protein